MLSQIDLTAYDKRVILVADLEWSIPRANIYVYETLSDTVSATVMKAEVFGIGAKAGWTTAAIRLLRGKRLDYGCH